MFDLLLPPVLPSWPIPANIRLDEDVMKTSFVFVFRRCLDQDEYVRLSLTSSEDVFKTSSRRLGQDQYIRLGHMSSRRLQDVFKTSSRPLQGVFKTSSRRLDQDEYVCLSLTSSEDVFKTSWSRPIYSSWLYVFKTSSRRFQDVFKTSCKNVFKTSSRRLAKISSRRFQDVSSS